MASIINATVTSPGGLVSTGDNTNELKIQTGETDAVTVNSSQVVAFNNPIVVAGNTISADNSLGFRNRIINGDMRIDQRNAGAAVTVNANNAFFPVDRFKCEGQNTDGVFTAQRDTSAPAGFVNSLKITVTTADASIGSTQRYQVLQTIEGTNVADLGWGTANAKTVTLSFWVRSSLTGTFGGSLRNSVANRSYPFAYTISAADTWEYKTVTITGDTSGTWETGTGTGILPTFSMGSGTNFQGTAGAWNGNNNNTVTGETQVIGTLNATWYVTGVQLEVGSVATPFERRPYGTELMLCQRYYWQQGGGRYTRFAGGIALGRSSTVATSMAMPLVAMRAFPTLSSTNIGDTRINGTAVSSVSINSDESTGSTIIGPIRVTANLSGLTAGVGYEWESNDNTTTRLTFSSEL